MKHTLKKRLKTLTDSDQFVLAALIVIHLFLLSI